MKRKNISIRRIKSLAALAALMLLPSAAAVAQSYTPEWATLARQAQTGDADAQYRMGCMYLEGKFVKSDPKEAYYWFHKSASNGKPEAMVEVARSFREGRGVIADNRIAAENYWRAAEKGNAEGAYRYAEMLRDGIGVTADRKKAYYWFSRAAEGGYADAAGQAAQLKPSAGTSAPAKKKAKAAIHKRKKRGGTGSGRR